MKKRDLYRDAGRRAMYEENGDALCLSVCEVLASLSVINQSALIVLVDYWCTWTVKSNFMKNVVSQKLGYLKGASDDK